MRRSLLIPIGLLLAFHGRAADFQFPSVPVGQSIQFEFTVTSGPAPLAGVDVSLAVLPRCGQVAPDRVTTDSSGKGRFTFIAGTQPGVCRISGSSAGTTLTGDTTVFRPEELVLGGAPYVQDWSWRAGTVVATSVTFTAGGLPLQFLPVEIGQFPAGGPTLVGSTRPSTDASGALSLRLSEGPSGGFYDLPITVAGQTRHVRMEQGQFPDHDVLRTPYKAWVPGTSNPPVVILPDGSAGACALSGVLRKSTSSGFEMPPGMIEYFNDLLDVGVSCHGPVKLRIEYPDPIPADAQLFSYRVVQFVGPVYQQLPAEVSGNAVTFTVPDLADQGGYFMATVGLALPGKGAAPAPPRIQDMWWGGYVENGWGMSIVQHPDFPNVTFAAIFAYDDAGDPTWWVTLSGDWKTGRGPEFTGQAYAPLGTPWSNYEPALLNIGEPAARTRLRIFDADNGTLTFTSRGITVVKPIQRMAFGPPATAQRPEVGGLWYGGLTQNGWGIAVLQQGDKLFSVWYTYGTNNKPTWFVMPDGQWTGATTFEGRLYRPHGSAWLGAAYDPSKLSVTDVGAFKLDFSASAPTFTYSVDGRNGSMRMERSPAYRR